MVASTPLASMWEACHGAWVASQASRVAFAALFQRLHGRRTPERTPVELEEGSLAGKTASACIGADAAYYDACIDQVWAANGIDTTIVPKPTAYIEFADGSRPDLLAAVERHVAEKTGTFKSDGTLVNPNFWSTVPASSFYPAAPANYCAKYWHMHGIGALAYGFSHDDVGGHSSGIGCNNLQRLIVGIGW